MQRLLALMVLMLLSINCMSTSDYIKLRSSPTIVKDAAVMPRGREMSLLQQLGSTSSGRVLPLVGHSDEAKTQRRAMTLGSRLEPVAGERMSPGVKAMRYGRRSQAEAISHRD